jgi:hypothetical protein
MVDTENTNDVRLAKIELEITNLKETVDRLSKHERMFDDIVTDLDKKVKELTPTPNSPFQYGCSYLDGYNDDDWINTKSFDFKFDN